MSPRAAARGVIAGVVVALALIPSYVFMGAAQPFLGAAIAGLLLGVLCATPAEALVGGGVYALGFSAFSIRYLSARWLEQMIARTVGEARFVQDVLPTTLYQRIWLVLAHSADPQRIGAVWAFAAAVIIAGGLASALATARSSGRAATLLRGWRWARDRDADALIGSALLALVLAVLLVCALASTGVVTEKARTPLANGEYATDFGIYVRTAQDMTNGSGYYDSMYDAIHRDARFAQYGEGAYPRPTPRWVRSPFAFYLMRTVGFVDLAVVPWFGLIVAAIAVWLIGGALDSRHAPGVGALAAVFVYPYFAMLGLWDNAFTPDYWAALLVVLSFGLLLRRMEYPGIAVALAAVACRETAIAWLFAVGMVVAWRALRERRWLPLSALGAGSAVVGALYVLHWRMVAAYTPSLLTPGAAGIAMKLPGSPADLAGIAQRLVVISNFVATPYTLHAFDGVWFLLAGAAYFAWRAFPTLRDGRVALAETAAVAFTGGMVLVLALQAHSSSYWGEMIVPLALVGVAGLAGLIFAPRTAPRS